MRLWGILGTLKAFLALGGSFSNSSSKVSVVEIGIPLGVPRVMFADCVSALLHFSFFPKIV